MGLWGPHRWSRPRQKLPERISARILNHSRRNQGGGRGPTTPRRLLRTEDMSENRLESINENSILLGTNFKGEKKLVLATETEDRGFIIGHRDNLERRVTEKNSSFWTGELQGGQHRKI